MNLSKSTGLSFFHSLLKSNLETRISKPPLLVFRQLLRSELRPNDFTFSLLIKVLASSPPALYSMKLETNQIHSNLIKSGINQFVYIYTALLDFYAKLGCLKCARLVFDEMPERDVVTWNALICGYSRNGSEFDALHLFVEMIREGFNPQSSTLVGLVTSCRQPEFVSQGKSIHGFGVKNGLDRDSRVGNAFTSMYAKCGNLEDAESLFEEMVEKNVVSWNTMIGAYGQNGLFNKSMLLFKKMRKKSVEANSVTIVSLLSADANPVTIHCFAIKTGIHNNASLVTSLVCVYARYGDTDSAELLYKSTSEENIVSLTAIISSYAEKGNMDLVVKCFARMQQLGIELDEVALVSILHGFQTPAYISLGHAFHGYGEKTGLCLYCLVSNGLIRMYSKFNDIEAALSLFSAMEEKPLISWNSIISGCVQGGRASDAMDLFCQMKMSGLNPDAITIASLLSGCSQLGYLQFGRKLHDHVLRNKLEVEDFVGTALIDMYIKCGSMELAERVFNSLNEPCLATWNTMITGHSLCGFAHEALTFFSELLEQGLKPDKITFLGVLAACTHGGLVNEGRRYFSIMTEEFRIIPTLQHYACMTGLLGRAGLFDEALLFIKTLEVEPDSAVWGALLDGCCIHQEVKLAEYLAKKMYLLGYKNGGLYVMMSNLYAARGMWDEVARVRNMMRDTGGDGCSGISLIEVTHDKVSENPY